jgi:predicted CXXCH cytochrome family protein
VKMKMSKHPNRTARSARFVLSLALLWQFGYITVAATPVTGRVARELTVPGAIGLFMPTTVAIADDGAAYVADGVNARVVRFAPDGTFDADWRVDATLQNPLAVTIDAQDRLWISDPPARTVSQVDLAGTVLQSWAVAGDPTGVIHDPQHGLLWVIENDDHRLRRIELDTGRQRVFGTRGDALGEYDYPYLAASAADGDLVVTDVINGRALRVAPDGQAVRAIGRYGVDIGMLYRPKGVAIDATGHIWISDSELGVIQVFSTAGLAVDVLRDANGSILRFQHPHGLAFGPQGHLYVVELGANRVVAVEVALLQSATRAPNAQPPRVINDQPRYCTACHLEWMRPLSDGRATPLVEPPENPEDLPHVSTAGVCLSCHDGSIVDSRRSVWRLPGHKRGVTPPADMQVSDKLPLVDGQIVCRTCHSAHTRGGSGNVLSEAVFLRVSGEPADLCGSCHADFDGGAPAGMHPLGTPTSAATDVPPVSCISCHAGHGSPYESLLTAGVQDNSLCVNCHTQLAPELFDEAHRSAHGRLPVMATEQRYVAAEWNTPIGQEGQLLCVTCHEAHEADSSQYLLAFNPGDKTLCVSCHADHNTIVDSSHDLRTSRPDIENLLGVSVSEGGACAACHTAHRPGLQPEPTAADTRGLCTSCHKPDGLAASHLVSKFNHEGECRSCHNPHRGDTRAFLAAEPAQLCSDCHAEQAPVRQGPHALVADGAWPAASVATKDTCLACHSPHADQPSGLYRAGIASDELETDGTCLACHVETRHQTEQPHAVLHPRVVQNTADAGGLPLRTGPQSQQIVACATCHDPHAAGESAKLLRIDSDTHAADICLTCHPAMKNVEMLGHAEEYLREAHLKAGSCQPCHVTHGSMQGVEQRYMWPTALGRQAPADAGEASHRCLGCHHTDGSAPAPAIFTHPDVEMFNPIDPNTPSYMPLFNADGDIDPSGTIACQTCHLTHGRGEPAPMPRGAENMPERELRARIWHLRVFGTENVCTTCHGFDALRRMIYFHDAERREGNVDQAPPNRGL